MITFFILLLAISAVPCVLVLPALLNKRKLRQIDRKQQNILIAKQRQAELQISSNDAIIDSAAQQQAEVELQEALLDDINETVVKSYTQLSGKWSILIIILLPLLSLMIYAQVGSPEYAHTAPPSVSASPQIQSPEHDINGLLERLESTIAENPENPTGWVLAARTYMTLRQFDKAEFAYAQLNKLVNDNADYLAGWADATIMVNNSEFNQHARELIDRALKINPSHINALWLAGLGAESLGNNQQALNHLQKLLPLVSDDEQSADQVKLMIKRNSNLLGLEVESTNTENEVATNQGKQIQVQVSITDTLNDQLTGNETIFVFARATSGPKVPLAVSRHSAKELPLKITLTSEMAMLPSMTIDQFDELTIAARVSKSGDPIAKPGDFSSNLEQLSAQYDGETVILEINEVVQ